MLLSLIATNHENIENINILVFYTFSYLTEAFKRKAS